MPSLRRLSHAVLPVALRQAGYKVIAVECGVPFCLTTWSRHVDKFIMVPDPAKTSLDAYLKVSLTSRDVVATVGPLCD